VRVGPARGNLERVVKVYDGAVAAHRNPRQMAGLISRSAKRSWWTSDTGSCSPMARSV
jgi:hypothetical protein